ncbi:phosphoribosylformylglycinamidine cyclo-ligase [Acuticoccus sp. I52.16.1]|uniref:phosphoribosylformylglycinamidine cyclo-ligase n=1 Tax=Acuticoccus sp. I52.16.1 TaxID=2928472 RepID=UPI001FCFF79D|nr:phosphoribosylformylglycinamidine cyclo-ligase [Acuticoccus sp. I52.16.1]UOM34704.1 phosphoribosylformylglycinamidine cyclo-ligase [Acuticoccus sp. I52.16.1]
MNDPRARYAAAGVNVEAGDSLVERIKPAAKSTARPGCAPALGGFAGLFDLGAAGHGDSLLVASTDGVGTKLRLAVETGMHRGVGIDLVAMCVNDVLAQGAEPLMFLDYYATGKLEVEAAAEIVEGIAEGCRQAGCALVGGETAEMPGHYAPGDYDLAGFVVGAVPRDRVLPQGVAAGDALIGLAASGAHSNGYSLIRRLAADKGWDLSAPFEDQTLAETLMTPTRIYVKPVLAAVAAHPVHGIAHITGGGITGNVPRMLTADLAAAIDRTALPPSKLMAFLAEQGGLSPDEMEATFNCGTGLVMAVAPEAADGVIADLEAAGETAARIGTVVAREGDGPQCLIS